jgi:GTPase Era involved in 16S rRNA processing
VGKDYNTLAIIGCQSSGKSTLLNKLFDTNFEVMVEEKGRGQTTQGIWIAMNNQYKLMIFDCEGTDSKERGEDRFRFEHCSSLFALAMADVLIINMWTNVI